jgi:hypothetical protein
VLSVARFDADVRRGTPAVVAGTAVGAVVGYLALADVARVSAGAAAFAGAVLGALAALLAVAAAFLAGAAAGRRAGAVVCVLLPLNFTAPLGLLVLLAVRS